MEAGFVAHCGTSMAGMYLHSLTMTDVSSGWMECMAMLYRDQEAVVQGLQRGITHLPSPESLDTDNGTGFLNRVLIGFCEREQIEFTRSRPYRKNDQCHVEQKNGAVVRRFVGYDRYEGQEARYLLADLSPTQAAPSRTSPQEGPALADPSELETVDLRKSTQTSSKAPVIKCKLKVGLSAQR